MGNVGSWLDLVILEDFPSLSNSIIPHHPGGWHSDTGPSDPSSSVSLGDVLQCDGQISIS